MRGFTNKGRYKRMMTQIPVQVVMNDKTALLGAASMAAQLTSSHASRHHHPVDLDSEKRQAALKATDFVRDGMVVGLGTGTTSKH